MRNGSESKRRKLGNMVSKEITINIPTGLEARPVALLVQVASQYESTILIECDNKKQNR